MEPEAESDGSEHPMLSGSISGKQSSSHLPTVSHKSSEPVPSPLNPNSSMTVRDRSNSNAESKLDSPAVDIWEMQTELNKLRNESAEKTVKIRNLEEEVDLLTRQQSEWGNALSQRMAREKDRHGLEIKTLLGEMEQMNEISTQLEEVVETAAKTEESLTLQLQGYVGIFELVAGNVRSLTGGVISLQQEILPPSAVPEADPPAFCLLQDSPSEPKLAAEGEVHTAIANLERRLALLQLCVEAKVETLQLLRTQAKEETEALRARMDELSSQDRWGSENLRRAEEAFNRERVEYRRDVEQLQQLYTQARTEMQGQMGALEERAIAAAAQTTAVQEELRTVREEKDVLQQAMKELQRDVASSESARLQLAADLHEKDREVEGLSMELSGLKLAQKYLHTGGGGVEGLAPETRDLVKLSERLQKEVVGLREAKEKAEAQIDSLRRRQTRDRVSKTITATEVDLVASNRVSEVELTAKILRRNMANSRVKDSESGNGLKKTSDT